MLRMALVSMIAFASAAASAQEADPALDDLVSGPSELDALSEGEQTDFPNIDAVQARKPVSVTLRALNKVTAKYRDIVINMNETAQFGALEITPRFCDKRPPEEFPETSAFVEIVDKSAGQVSDLKAPAEKHRKKKKSAPAVLDDATPEATSVAAPTEIAHSPAAADAGKALPEGVIFSGWMFASSPALNGVDHPVYDVWAIDCKTVDVES